FMTPLPLQVGHAPIELKLKRPAGCPVSFEKIVRMLSMMPIYVANVERVETPILAWLTVIVSGSRSLKAFIIKELLPEPETPQIETKQFLGISMLIFFKL